MKTILMLICISLILAIGCEIPYTGHLGPEGFNGWIESEKNGFVCLWNGFDRLCIQTIEGPAGKDGKDGRDGRDGRDGKDGKDGKDGRDGKDGQTFIAIREVFVEIIVEKIIETVVVAEIVKEVPVEIVVERVVTEYVDREVPITVFVERTVEIIKEVIKEVPVEKTVEVEVIKEVPVETIKEIEVIKEVPVEKIVEVVKTVYVTETPPISVTAGAIYTESGYHNPPNGFHAHEFTHTHDGATHTHRIIHPNGEQDDWDREHNGWAGLAHD